MDGVSYPLYEVAGRRYFVAHVRPSRFTDHERNRKIVESAIQDKVLNFRPYGLGTWEGSLKHDGTLLRLDSHHRGETCKRVEYDDPVLCKIWVGLTDEQEFDLIDVLNNLRAWRKAETFSIRTEVSANTTERDIKSILDSLDIGVNPRGGDMQISATATVVKIYKQYGRDHLRKTLLIPVSAFGGEAASLAGQLLEAWSILANEEFIEMPRLIQVLAQWPDGVPAIVERASAARGGAKRGLPEWIADVVRNQYVVRVARAA